MAQLVPGDEPHGLRDGVEGNMLIFLDALLPHREGKLLVARVARALGTVVCQH